MAAIAHRVHRFTLALSGIADDLSDAELDRLYEAGCGDSSIGCTAGDWSARFSREAPSLAEAIISAVRDIEAANVEGLLFEGVTADEPDQLDGPDLAAVAYLDARLRARRPRSRKSGRWPAGSWPRPTDQPSRHCPIAEPPFRRYDEPTLEGLTPPV